MTTPDAKRRSRWMGPIVVAACAVLSVVVFGGLAVYRLQYGWEATVEETDRTPFVTAKTVEKLLDEFAIRKDKEEWSKVWSTGNRCTITYRYDHPDIEKTLVLESYLFTETSRRHSFEVYRERVDEFQNKFAAMTPGSIYVARDEELQVDDQSRFGSYNIDDEPVAYFFARRRGLHVYFGYVRCSEINDLQLGEVFSAPSNVLDEWDPSP